MKAGSSFRGREAGLVQRQKLAVNTCDFVSLSFSMAMSLSSSATWTRCFNLAILFCISTEWKYSYLYLIHCKKTAHSVMQLSIRYDSL